MQTITKQIKEYVLSEDEARIVKECLVYCRHRLTEHNDSGIQGYVSVEKVNKIINEFKNTHPLKNNG
jgi:hypothetical protein